MKSFKKRLILPLDGNSTVKLYNASKTLVAVGYRRVVIGARGPYVEFEKDNICWDKFSIPEELLYRLENKVVYYVEYRSQDDDYTKLYLQKRPVLYADYRVGLIYISPKDLYLSTGQKGLTD